MTRKLNTALIIILLVALTCVGLASGQDQEKDHEFKVLIGSGLLNADEAFGVLRAENSSPYELASLVGRAWTRVSGTKTDSLSARIVIDVPSIVKKLPELKNQYSNFTLETLESLMGLTYKYRSELSDLGYGFYFGRFAVYQGQDNLTLYGLWDEDREVDLILTEMVKPFVASYTNEIADWARFRLEYVSLSEVNKRLAGEIQLGNLALGGALLANNDESYRIEAALRFGSVQLGAGVTAGADIQGNRVFTLPDLGFSFKLGEFHLATYNAPSTGTYSPIGVRIEKTVCSPLQTYANKLKFLR